MLQDKSVNETFCIRLSVSVFICLDFFSYFSTPLVHWYTRVPKNSATNIFMMLPTPKLDLIGAPQDGHVLAFLLTW